MAEFDRRVLQIVEIDMERCGRTFGVGLCDAALSAKVPDKCFNTFATCPRRAAFSPTTQTVRFAHNISDLPAEAHIYPALKSVSVSAAEINTQGIDADSSAMGKRARVTIRLQDFTDADYNFDKYAEQRRTGAAQFSGQGYKPEERGSFLQKLRARDPYYTGWAFRLLTGYVGDRIEDMTAAHYVVTEWDGPSASGEAEITAKDVLDLVDNDKAVLPAVTRGQLLTNMDSAGLGTYRMQPAGIGALEYPTSGWVAIGSEILSFTRSGDMMTITGRGLFGTEASSHEAGDTLQNCERFHNLSLAQATYEVCSRSKRIPASYLDLPEWRSEEQGWLLGFNLEAIVPKPVGVSTLLGELQQFGCTIWPDVEAQKIRFRVNRPVRPDEPQILLTDDDGFIEKTSTVTDEEKLRISQMFLWHGMLDATGDLDKASNFKRGVVGYEDTARTYKVPALQSFGTRWLGMAGDDAIASAVAERLVARFSTTPRTFEAMIDQNRAEMIKLGDPVFVRSRLMVDAFGLPVTTMMVVKYIAPSIAGHRVKVKLETFSFEGNYGYWAADSTPDYDAATETQREEVAFWFDPDQEDGGTQFSDGREAYQWY